MSLTNGIYGNQFATICTHSDVPVHNIIPFKILKQFYFITTHKHHRSRHNISNGSYFKLVSAFIIFSTVHCSC